MPYSCYQRLLDWIYPSSCVSCQQFISGADCLCTKCKKRIKFLKPPYCQQCSEPFEGQIQHHFSCPNCKKMQLSFNFARAAVVHNKASINLVHQLKYGKKTYITEIMAEMMQQAFEKEILLTEHDWLIVPVPMHWLRQSKRGFNQAQLLANSLSKRLELPKKKLLTRSRRTINQANLNRKKRLKNLINAFKLKKTALPKKTNILLIDDVLTTGSTAHQCAKVLKQHPNIETVAVLTFMRS